jgi:phosphopantothenoylcysteine synthetase/decarboxylase
MQITCIDLSDGRLFFIDNILSVLNNFKQDVYLYVPANFRDLYGIFLDHFPQIKVKKGLEKNSNFIINVIFSNFNNLQKLQDFGRSLVYPVLRNNEIKDFFSWFNQLSNRLKSNVIPIETSDADKSIIHPESKWAIDMLKRQISEKSLTGISVLISAGPTIEDIDPVRYLTNRSSGKMGIALARAAYMHGADVQLILGPSNIAPPAYLPVQRIRSAEDMYNAVITKFEKCDVYIGSAAIADFTPANVKSDKIKKKDGFSELILQPTKDILNEISAIKKKQLLIGFSVETKDMIENSKSKLVNKNLDLVLVNNPKDKGAAFDADTNVVTIIHKDGKIESWPIMSKLGVADKLMAKIGKLVRD